MLTPAYAAFKANEPLKPHKIERRSPGADDVQIDIKYCGVCHSDLHQVRDEWGGSTFPMVPGHEIVGLVTAVGKNVQKYKVGDKVGVGCMVNSCQHCPACAEGLEQYCVNGMVGTYNGIDKDGSPTYGGYSTMVVVDQNFVLKIPENLPLDAAAPLLCAGITTYSPLRTWKAGNETKVAVMGLGGLGHMAVKLARAMGSHVTILSHSEKKRQDGERLGAHDFLVMKTEEDFAKNANRFDLIINTVSAPLDINAYVSLLNRDATMVLLGVPPKPHELPAFSLIGGRRRIAGSLIGGIKETQEMLDFCGKHNIVSDIELIKMNEINEAYERMLKGDVKYRFVIDLASLS
jgi:uncharacterized zinc-type alcohol dehydrogenase-like protein